MVAVATELRPEQGTQKEDTRKIVIPREVEEAVDRLSDNQLIRLRQLIDSKIGKSKSWSDSFVGEVPRLILTTFFPPFMMFIGWVTFKNVGVATYNDPVRFNELPHPYTWLALLVSAIALGGWLLYNIKVANDFRTSIVSLKREAAVSIAMGLITTAIGGAMFINGTLYWWYVAPLFFSVCDAISSATVAINNAGQKPLFQQSHSV